MARSGGISKNSPLTQAQIWGLTPNFKILFYGDPQSLQILKKIFTHFWEKNSNIWRKFKFWGVMGNFHVQKFLKKSRIVPSMRGPNKVGLRFGLHFFLEKPFSPLPPVQGAPISTAFKWRKKTSNGVGWCWWYIHLNTKKEKTAHHCCNWWTL